MLEDSRSELYVFQIYGRGVSKAPPPLLVIDANSAYVMENPGDYESVRSNYSIVADARRQKQQVKQLASKIIEVVSTRFFSQATGVEMVEFASFEGNELAPKRRRFAVTIKGATAALYSSSSMTEAAGWAATEDKELILQNDLKDLLNPNRRKSSQLKK